ncbi:hypothetical protein [uncultured Aquimarina sp.]|uniref:hypothetical protein n=1 Tax=uncultured Aquimarina sp. TaxID=575652 RepID=UPI002617DDB7|nr:hypothetical protein [uncultured Aquimarina sp.]
MKLILKTLIILILVSCDSLSKDEKLIKDREKLTKELKNMVELDQKGRLFITELKKKQLDSNLIKFKRDSFWSKQIIIDNNNVKRLIEITNTYGFPNVDRLQSPVPAWLIFQHTPEEYKEEVSDLLIEEHKSGRMPTMEYNMIKWHLTGRKGSPFSFTE